MKYFLDTEFIEGFRKPLFGKRRHFIDLISIGIVCEDGRTYYAISTEFNEKDADEWVKKNVIDKLEQRAKSFYDSPGLRQNALLYKSNKEIAEEIVMFCYPEQSAEFKNAKAEFLSRAKEYGWIADQPEFYGYYADYDWVLFCSLFGRMIDLPKGFPMYCRDLKQMLDEKAQDRMMFYGHVYQKADGKDNISMKESLDILKSDPAYPKQHDEHNALADAKWNFELYKFLATV